MRSLAHLRFGTEGSAGRRRRAEAGCARSTGWCGSGTVAPRAREHRDGDGSAQMGPPASQPRAERGESLVMALEPRRDKKDLTLGRSGCDLVIDDRTLSTPTSRSLRPPLVGLRRRLAQRLADRRAKAPAKSRAPERRRAAFRPRRWC